MAEEKRGRGRPRQGPFSGGKETFTTKITTLTLDRLARSARKSQMSISQKGEAAIIRGLDQEDDFERYLAPAFEAFRLRATLAMPDRARPVDVDALRAALKVLIGKFADDLLWSVEVLASSIVPTSQEAEASETHRAVPSSSSTKTDGVGRTLPSPKRIGRKIDIE